MRIVYNRNLFSEAPIFQSPEFSAERLIHVPKRRRAMSIQPPGSREILLLPLTLPEFKFLILPTKRVTHWHPRGSALLTLLQISDEECIPFYLPTNNFWGCVCLSDYLQEEHESPIDYFWNSAFACLFSIAPLAIVAGDQKILLNNMLTLRKFDNYEIDIQRYRYYFRLPGLAAADAFYEKPPPFDLIDSVV